MDTQTIKQLLDLGLSGVMIIGLVYVLRVLWRRLDEVQEARVQDSKEREETVVIALQAVTQGLENYGGKIDAIRISLDKQDDKGKKTKA